MENTYGYIRTSRQRIAGEAGSDPEAQAHQLRGAGVAPEDIYRDVGGLGQHRHQQSGRLAYAEHSAYFGRHPGSAAIDRIGRRWMDTVNAVRDLRVRGVKIKSL